MNDLFCDINKLFTDLSYATGQMYSLRNIIVGNTTKTSAKRTEKKKMVLTSVQTMVSTLPISVISLILLNKLKYECSNP